MMQNRNTVSNQLEPLEPGLVTSLSAPTAYPFDVTGSEGVSTLQTHISHVFLTTTRVYKLRKAVNLGFLDFGTRQSRNEDCVREVRLNRRLAPDVYLGVAPVWMHPDGARVGAVEESPTRPDLEHCVVMRRLSQGRDALSLAADGTLADRHVDAIARVLARFHETHALGRPAPYSAAGWLTAVSTPVEDNFKLLEGTFDDDRLSLLATSAREFLRAHAEQFEVRRRLGRVVDGHGDVHLGHIWFEREDSEPLFIDCIEFSDRLRRIDAASEVAFLAMDLAYRGLDRLSDRFLRRYATDSGDPHLFTVVSYYLSYRAAVRAKVAAIAASEPEIGDEQQHAARASAGRHLDLAIEFLRTR